MSDPRAGYAIARIVADFQRSDLISMPAFVETVNGGTSGAAGTTGPMVM